MRSLSLFLGVFLLFLAASAGLLFVQMDHGGHQLTDCANGTCVAVSHSTAPTTSCLDQCLALVERDVFIPTISTVFFAFIVVVLLFASRIIGCLEDHWRRYLRDPFRISLLHQHLSTVVLLD